MGGEIIKKYIYFLLLCFVLAVAVSSVSASDVDAVAVSEVDVDSNLLASDVSNLSSENESSNVNESVNDSNIKTNPIKTIITAPNVKFKYADVNSKLLITLKDINGNAIFNKTIFVTLKGLKTYTLTTNEFGIATFAFKLAPKTYAVSISFKGDDEYLASKGSSKITVKKASTTIIAPKVQSYLTTSTYLRITLKDSNGFVLSKKKVYVKVGYKTYKLTTDKNGVAKLKFSSKIRNTKVSVKFKGTSYYSASSVNTRVIVTKMPVIISAPAIKFDSNKYGNFLITLKDKKGKVLKNKYVYVTLYSLKKTYKLKTNSAGVAKLKFGSIKSSDVVVKFIGNKNYYSKTVKSKFTVNPIKVKYKDVITGATYINDHVKENNKLPSTVTVNNNTFTIYQFSYLISAVIKNANNGKKSDIVLAVVSNTSTSTKWIYHKFSKKNYIKLNNNIYNYILNKYTVPSYVKLGDTICFRLYTSSFSKMLEYYNSKNKLPSSYEFTSVDFVKYAPLKDCTFYLTSDNIVSKSKDKKMLNQLAKTLKSRGYKTKIVGIGPNYHNIAYKYGCTGGKSVLVCCFGGVDVGCIEEWTGQLNTYFVNNYKGARILSIWYSKPYGKCADINKKVRRAWDANYGWALDNPAKYMASYGIGYIQAGNADKICESLTSVEIPGLNLSL